jgi:hypothetical protein
MKNHNHSRSQPAVSTAGQASPEISNLLPEPLLTADTAEAPVADEVVASSLTPLQDALNALSPHFVALGPAADQAMAVTLTLACPLEWVCYASPRVRLLPPIRVAHGVLVRLIGADAAAAVPGSPITGISVDELLVHGAALVKQNRNIEARRQEIIDQQLVSERSLREQIAALMADTGGFVLDSVAPPAPVAAPVAAPAAVFPFVEIPRPPAYIPPTKEQMSRDTQGGTLAPTLEQLARSI